MHGETEREEYGKRNGGTNGKTDDKTYGKKNGYGDENREKNGKRDVEKWKSNLGGERNKTKRKSGVEISTGMR